MSNTFKISQIDGAVPEKKFWIGKFYDKQQETQKERFSYNEAVDTFANTELEVDIEGLAKELHRMDQEDKHAHRRIEWNDPDLSKESYRRQARTIADQLPKILKVRK